MTVAPKTIEKMVSDSYIAGRNDAIEECALKVDQMLTVVKQSEDEELIRAVADVIRALKDKP